MRRGGEGASSRACALEGFKRPFQGATLSLMARGGKRDGAGRPTKYHTGSVRKISVSLSHEALERLERVAVKLGKDKRSEALTRIIERFPEEELLRVARPLTFAEKVRLARA